MAISRPNPQYGQSPSPQQPEPEPQPRPKGSTTILVLGAVAVLGVVLGLSIAEHGHNAWGTVHAWGGLAVVGALATLAPALGRGVGLSGLRAWQVAACGAGALGLFWVLFVLPVVGSNTSLLTTVGVAAGVTAAWLAPGREPAVSGEHGW